jgi:hypothetical protein
LVKKKGYFFENIVMFISAQFFVLTCCVLKIIESKSGMKFFTGLMTIKNNGILGRFSYLFVIIVILWIHYALIKYYYGHISNYVTIIKNMDLKYKKKNKYFFLFFFVLFSILIFSSLYFINFILR